MTYPTYIMTVDNGLSAAESIERQKKQLQKKQLQSTPVPRFISSNSAGDQSNKSVALLEKNWSLASESGLKRSRSMIGSFKFDDLQHGRTTHDLPATRALNAKLIHPPILKSNMTIQTQESRPLSMKREEERMIPEWSLKGSRSGTGGAFKLDDLLEATRPVEDSIAFPTIEWSFVDDDNEHDNKDEKYQPDLFPPPRFSGGKVLSPLESFEEDVDEYDCSHRTKRICRGLVRSKKIQTDLSSLANLSA